MQRAIERLRNDIEVLESRQLNRKTQLLAERTALTERMAEYEADARLLEEMKFLLTVAVNPQVEARKPDATDPADKAIKKGNGKK